VVAAVRGRVQTESPWRHPRFLLFCCATSVLLNGGRRCCLVTQRSSVVTALVRLIRRLGRRAGYWG